MRLHFRRSAAALMAIGAAALLAGCGGSSVGNTATARIRVVDTSPNAGTANILINGASAYGDMTYFTTAGNASQPASPYLYIGPQTGVPFTYTTSQSLPSGASASTNNYDLSQDQYYTAFLIGRYDTYSSSPSDPRFLQVVVPAPRASANSSLATLRVLNAAPDAGFTTPTVNNVATPTAGSVNVSVGAPATSFNGVTYATASSYQTLAPGSNISVTVTLPGGGSVTTGTINLSAGTVYTLVVAENAIPNGVTPATYELRLLSE